MKKILMNFSMFFVFLFAQTSLFGNTATPPSGSFFNVSVSGLTLSLTTTSYNPNDNYQASIQITSPDYTIASGCALESSTSCHFPVNQNLTANIVLQGATSTVTYVLCLNATIPATCGTYSSGVVAGLALSPSSLPAASLSTAYNQTISASGGVAPYTYAITAGSLPLGLSLNGTTGEISGTPTSTGTYPFTVTATDSTAPTAITGSQAYSVVVSGTLTLTPTTLPAGVIGTAYSQTLTVDSIATPINYLVTSGTLPIGLTLNGSTGVISGTPTTAGTYPFTVTATDTNGNTGLRGYSVVISGTLTLTPTTLPAGGIGAAYSQTLTVDSIATPINYLVTSGTLPIGLILNASTGVISGTPTTAGTYPFTITATDLLGNTGARAYSITINLPGIITGSPSCSSLPAEFFGTSLNWLGSSAASYSLWACNGNGCMPNQKIVLPYDGTTNVTATLFTVSTNTRLGCNYSWALCPAANSSYSSSNCTNIIFLP